MAASSIWARPVTTGGPHATGYRSPPRRPTRRLVKGIAKEEGKNMIRANSVLVGVIDAGQLHKLTELGQLDAGWVAETHKLLAIKRWGSPEEIGHACAYFASNEAAYVTGQTISVSGGFGV